MHLKMLSASVIRCIYLLTLLTYVIIEANNVDPDQTVPIGAARSGYTLSAKEAS